MDTSQLKLRIEKAHSGLQPEFFVQLLDETESTMNVARELTGADKSNSNQGVVIARKQLAGRGRNQREWISNKDAGIWATYVLRPEVRVEALSGFSLAVGIALRNALKQYGIDASLKWPNDVLVQKGKAYRKIAGILIELVTQGQQLEAALVGIGLNISPQKLPEEFNAISIEELTENKVDFAELLTKITIELLSISEKYFTSGFDSIREQWLSCSMMNGHKVLIREGSRVHTGKVCGVDHRGGLQLNGEGGELTTVYSGDVELID